MTAGTAGELEAKKSPLLLKSQLLLYCAFADLINPNQSNKFPLKITLFKKETLKEFMYNKYTFLN